MDPIIKKINGELCVVMNFEDFRNHYVYTNLHMDRKAYPETKLT